MCGVTTKDQVSSQDLLERIQHDDLTKVLRNRRFRWYVHEERCDGWLKKVQKINPAWSRVRGRPKMTWTMLCTAQLGGPVLKASGRVQYTPFQLGEKWGDKSPMIKDQHTAGGSVSQLSQLTKLSPWSTLSTKDITTSFWYYNEWFWFSSDQIVG